MLTDMVVSDNLQKRAVKMLLQGATLLAEPCPYCKGVRVMSNGYALCVSCGSKPEKKTVPVTNFDNSSLKDVLQQKIESLSKELESESDHKKQQDILKMINSLLDTANKVQDNSDAN